MSDKIREAYHTAYPISAEWLQQDGTYSHEPTQCGWDGFHAGWKAAIAQQTAPVAVPDYKVYAVIDSMGWDLDDQEKDDMFRLCRTMLAASAPAAPVEHEPSKLEKLLAEEERSHDMTIDQRDRAEDMATKLAEAVGEYFGRDVGDHSSANCPWENALELLNTAPPAAEQTECSHCYGSGSIHGTECGACADQPDTVKVPRELLELLREMIDLHKRRGCVLTAHMEHVEDLLGKDGE